MSRLAEKPRKSTCEFADDLCRLALSHFPPTPSDHQRCLAAILLHHPDTGLKVVSIGEGTKFLSPSSSSSPSSPTAVKDMHAEVLALRGFKRHLWSLLSQLPPDTRYALPPSMTVHMYTSSAPCGDACVRRWSKGTKPRTYEGEPGWRDGAERHNNLNGQAVEQGQFALLLKGGDGVDGGEAPGGLFPPPAGTSYASGAAPPSPRPHTCSDKILLRNHLGIQGTLLTSHVSPPRIRLSSVTVGRKYSAVGCRRAFCCRSEAYRRTKKCRKVEGRREEKWDGEVDHPAVMCTKVKDDEGTTEGGAVFSDVCRVGWVEGGRMIVEELDGATGMRRDGGESGVSCEEFGRLARARRGEEGATLAEMKKGSDGWEEKRRLMEGHGLFNGWLWKRREEVPGNRE